MRNQSAKNRKLLNTLRLWWLILSGTTLRIFAILGAISIVALIAIGSFSGFNAPELNAENTAVAPVGPSVPQLVLIDKDTDALRVESIVEQSHKGAVGRQLEEIPASGKDDEQLRMALEFILDQPDQEDTQVEVEISEPQTDQVLLAQASSNQASPLQLQLKDLVDQAMNPSSEDTAVEESTEPATQAAPAESKPKTTNDLLKELVSGAKSSPAVAGDGDGDYISRISAESETTVVIDQETAQQTADTSLSNSDRLLLIQDIAKRVAQDSQETVENVDYVTVEENDSLWFIAQRLYGDPYKYKLLYSANRDILLNENSLIVGQKLRVPRLE